MNTVAQRVRLLAVPTGAQRWEIADSKLRLVYAEVPHTRQRLLGVVNITIHEPNAVSVTQWAMPLTYHNRHYQAALFMTRDQAGTWKLEENNPHNLVADFDDSSKKAGPKHAAAIQAALIDTLTHYVTEEAASLAGYIATNDPAMTQPTS